VVLAPGATFGPAKRWPAERFAALGRELQARDRCRIVLVGGPGDREVGREVARALETPPLVPPPIDLVGETDLATLGAVLAGARLVVANDSGPMHLARAVGAPTVGIFGSTAPKWTAPRGGEVVTADERPGCAPCYRRTCSIAVQCLVRIPVGAVRAAADRALAESRARK
jgi:heptosyltransferase-2